jgi:plasmid replication initiation protein
MKNLLVYKANEVIEAGYKLTLNELRVVLACIAQVNSSEELLETDEFELSAKDFAVIFEVSQDESYRALIDVTESLFNRYVVIENPDFLRPHPKKAKRLRTRWISGIRYYPDEGGLSLRFAQDMLPYLSSLKNAFTRYRLEHVGRMTSIYAMRLYELLAQWQSVGKREVNIEWLKQQFEIENQYSNMNDFKKRVLDPAVSDINEYSNFNVIWEQRKTGRRVTHLTFTFAEKKPEKLAKLKPKIKATPQTPEKSARKIDNVEHFAKLHKQYGELGDAGIPDDMKEILKAQGRW